MNELETFYRANSGFQLEKDKSVITEEEAIVAANDILEAGTEITSIRLATVKTNTYFNSSVTKDEIRLAYLISTPSDVVYVDAYTAEVIGGDTYQSRPWWCNRCIRIDYCKCKHKPCQINS